VDRFFVVAGIDRSWEGQGGWMGKRGTTTTTHQKFDSNPDSNVAMKFLSEVVWRVVTIGLLSAILFA
jgi:hypothetical protein